MKVLIATLLSGLIIGTMCAKENEQQPVNAWAGTYSGTTEHKEVVIRDAESWKQLWTQIHSNSEPKPDVPAIDFSKNMIVGYLLGQKSSGGYSVAIESIDEVDDKTVVTITVSSPGRGSLVTQVITSPYALQATAKSDKEVIFKAKSKQE